MRDYERNHADRGCPGRVVGHARISRRTDASNALKSSSIRIVNSLDQVIELYKRDVDRTLLRENLRLTPEQRLVRLMELQRFAEELQRAGKEQRRNR
jgi:hypothetical protein